MTTKTEKRADTVSHLLKGTFDSIENVVPINHDIAKPVLFQQALQLDFGVLIGITGDIKGKIVFSGNRDVFSAIGETMYGMALEGEMLASFSGELGNMIAGGISKAGEEKGINMDITFPTILEGETSLTGYEKAIQVPVFFENAGGMTVYLLIDL
ncbi:chemotaxis protein CheX [Virgibacillus sp. MSP4-1]|uniref:chemotaxis protein CheX n=1 Tax=Virgibacillus sp. MSP4-1 TaxID=2700081 RepID=UPI00039D5DBA|nr:chemotaxis protein CheX [Virgibacillus sp. MSP4-1]QHS23449.1 chemotaxis protein CheX [Virgibacillus sp. MSP4-1]